MTVTTPKLAGVLHIRRPSCARADEVDYWLADAGLAVERVGDVYRGLAMLARSSKVRAVVVSVDTLDGLEHEFFGLAARIRPGIHLLVYGREGSESKIEQALLSGAGDRTTVFGLRTLAARLAEAHEVAPGEDAPAARSDLVSAESGRAESESSVDELPSVARATGVEAAGSNAPESLLAEHSEFDLECLSAPRVAEQAEANDAVNAAEEEIEAWESDDNSSALPRFPWARPSAPERRQGPQRTPPSRDGQLPPRLHPVPMPRDIDETPAGSSEERESLLTPDELAALLGDDLAAFQTHKPRREGGAP